MSAYQAGRLCQRQGPYAEALEHLTQATQLAPSRPEAHLALSQVHRQRQRPQEALQHAERALSLTLQHRPHGQQAEPWVYQYGAQDELATVHSLIGRSAEAIAAWQALLERVPATERPRLEANIAWARAQAAE